MDVTDALRRLAAAAREAGELALPYFRDGRQTTAAITYKAGNSPVTEADHLLDRFLTERLRPQFPDAGWLSEESVDDPARLACRDVLIVDPIDGTRGFIAGDDRWSVCLALVRDGAPIAGVVRAPARDETFAGALHHGATLNGARLACSRRTTLAGARIAGPKPMTDNITRLGAPVERTSPVPSLAYRFAELAAGRIDAALASANAHDWDIAAADILIREAGGVVAAARGGAPVYNRAQPHHGPLIAAGPALMSALQAVASRLDP